LEIFVNRCSQRQKGIAREVRAAARRYIRKEKDKSGPPQKDGPYEDGRTKMKIGACSI
jgi:hypothetical protein